MNVNRKTTPSSPSERRFNQKRILIVLYAGDYREAYKLIQSGRGEAYYGQEYAIKAMTELIRDLDSVEEVAILCCKSEEEYDELVEPGLRVLGAAADPYRQYDKVIEVFDGYKPTNLVLRLPNHRLLQWAIQNKVKTITILADSFNLKGILSRFSYFRLAQLLNQSVIEWVGNHGVSACLSLKQIGVKSQKLIPWDWPHLNKPGDFSAKSLRSKLTETWHILYVGTVTRAKGIDDLIHAVKILHQSGQKVQLDLIGRGELERVSDLANFLDVAGHVNCLGVIPNREVIPRMQATDVVVVPSHHNYPEGFPLVIYEALCARTPLLVSDHPMFVRNLKHGHSALIFPEKKPEMLAECIEKLLSDANLYEQISVNTEAAWHSLQIPVLWGSLIKNWIIDSRESRQWLVENSLDSGQYRKALEIKS